jgi:hypothetical protein
MNAVCSRFLEEARDLIQNITVALSIGVIEAWGVDECKDAAIGCGPVMDADVRRRGPDAMTNFDSRVLGDKLDELFVE